MMNVFAQASELGLEPSSRERNLELYNRLHEGDPDARREMIESNIGVVSLRVDSFIRRFPQAAYLKEDLISEGLLGLTECIDDMRDSPRPANPNPNGYIYTAISNAIGSLVDSETNMQLSSRQVKRCKDTGEKVPSMIAMGAGMPDVLYDETAIRMLRDQIHSCAEDGAELKILEMREDGYSYQEIANAINRPLSTTYMLLRDMYERFLAKTGMKDKTDD